MLFDHIVLFLEQRKIADNSRDNSCAFFHNFFQVLECFGDCSFLAPPNIICWIKDTATAIIFGFVSDVTFVAEQKILEPNKSVTVSDPDSDGVWFHRYRRLVGKRRRFQGFCLKKESSILHTYMLLLPCIVCCDVSFLVSNHLSYLKIQHLSVSLCILSELHLKTYQTGQSHHNCSFQC